MLGKREREKTLLLKINIQKIRLIPETRDRVPGHPGEGDSHIKGAGVNCGFWSHLGCSGQNAIIFSHKGKEDI